LAAEWPLSNPSCYRRKEVRTGTSQLWLEYRRGGQADSGIS